MRDVHCVVVFAFMYVWSRWLIGQFRHRTCPLKEEKFVYFIFVGIEMVRKITNGSPLNPEKAGTSTFFEKGKSRFRFFSVCILFYDRAYV